MRRALAGALAMLLLAGGAFAGGKGTVTGRVVGEDGTSFEGCKACFFNTDRAPAPRHDSLWWRIPDAEFDGLLDINGRFTAEVEEGQYVVASVKRNEGSARFGPPAAGEQVFISELSVVVKTGEVVNLGTGYGKARRQDAPVENLAMIEGKLLDRNGFPFNGGFVVADPGGFLSRKTSYDGSFVLYLPKGGTYRLVARDNYGGYT